jgi:hypothetical protein
MRRWVYERRAECPQHGRQAVTPGPKFKGPNAVACPKCSDLVTRSYGKRLGRDDVVVTRSTCLALYSPTQPMRPGVR